MPEQSIKNYSAMKNEKEKISIYLASLLHDIGKILERGEYYKELPEWFKTKYRHAGIGAYFIEENKNYFSPFESFLDNVQRLIRNHHSPSSYDEKIIALSDWLSAGEREYEEMVSFIEEGELIPPFSQLFIENRDYNYPLNPISFPEDIFPKRDILKSDYKKIIEGFINDFKFLPDSRIEDLFSSPFEFLYFLLYKHFSFIPAQKGKYLRDISIFDHSRLCVAISLCLIEENIEEKEMDNVMENLREYFKTGKREFLERVSECTHFLLLKGDISGIKEFIFSIPTKGAAKSLKGRSIYLSLLNYLIAKYILKELNLSLCNLIYEGGGNFFLLLPYSKKEKVLEIRRDILETIFKVHKTNLYMAITFMPLTYADFFEGNISEKWNILGKKSLKEKLSKFKEIGEIIFEIEDLKGEKCEICGKTGLDEKGEDIKLCEFCYSFIELTNSLKNAKYYFEKDLKGRVSEIKDYKGLFKYIGFEIGFSKDKERGAKNYVLNNTEFEDGVTGFKFLPISLPLQDGEIIDFDNLAKRGKGYPSLSYLKMDIDNLGKIFYSGFEKNKRTFSRLAFLSRMIDLFFSFYINEIHKDFKDNIYIIYSGGDDLFAVGSFYEIIQFHDKLRKKFEEFVCFNPYITLSSSILIFDEKYPLYKALRLCDECLESAKENFTIINLGGNILKFKNKVNIMNYLMDYKNEKGIEGSYFKFKEYLEKFEKEEDENLRRILKKILFFSPYYKKTKEELLKGKIYIKDIWRFSYYLREELNFKIVKEIIEDYERWVVECIKENKIKINPLFIASKIYELKIREV